MPELPLPLPSLRTLATILGLVMLGGCVAAALAEDEPELDRVIRKDGGVIEGQIEAVRDGVYMVRQVDGMLRAVPIDRVDRLELSRGFTRGPEPEPAAVPAASQVVPATPVARPSSSSRAVDDLGGGVDVGLGIGGRLRVPSKSDTLSHIDVRTFIGFGVLGGSPYGFIWAGPQLAFFKDSPVHLTAAGVVGVPAVYASSAFLATGPGVQVEVGKAGHFDAGAMVGLSLYGSAVVIPDLTFGWVW